MSADRVLLVRLRLRRILADHVQTRGAPRAPSPRTFASWLCRFGLHRHTPELLEALRTSRIENVLESEQPVGNRPHVAAALHVVLAAQRIDARSVSGRRVRLADRG